MTNIAVVVVSANVNKKLSIVSPPQLSATGDATLPSAGDSDPVRRVTFESQKFTTTRRSVADRTASLINTVRASLLMETAKLTLYWGSTALVRYIFVSINPNISWNRAAQISS